MIEKEKFFNDESGASAVEYSLLLGLIAIVIMVAITALGQTISNLYTNFSGTLTNINTTGS